MKKKDYTDVYTKEELELNRRLFEECIKENPDKSAIRALLDAGADTLGGIGKEYGMHAWHVYGEVVSESQDTKSVNLPMITELFLEYGMDIDNPKIPYDFEDSLNPMWDFALVMNENSVYALKMLLDNGLSADSAGLMWSHAAQDTDFSPENQDNDFWEYERTWFMKLTMLCASYDHILENDPALQEYICCGTNSFDIHNFRNWDDFYYEFNITDSKVTPDFYKTIVHICRKSDKSVVWTIRLGFGDGEA